MTTRRQFIIGCSAAIAAMAGGRVGNLVFADPTTASAAGSDEILVTVFLRGGCDGLSLVSPYDDAIYQDKRGRIALLDKPEDQGGVLKIDSKNSTFKSNVGLHPGASGLRELYNQGHLAIVHACGLNNETRSHFDAMDYIERGTPGNKNYSSGWLARHLRCVHPDGLLPTLAAASAAPSSLLGEPGSVAMNDPRSYNLSAPWRYYNDKNPAMLNSLTKFYTGSDAVQAAGKRTIETIKAVGGTSDYTPAVTYPNDDFSRSLKTVAQMIKLEVGLRVATVDLGGWDHHEHEGVNDSYGPFNRLAGMLAGGLNAFYNDLSAYQNRLTVVVMSEFGRRLGVNQSEGTDHGHGNMMLVLGGNVNGGKVYGKWPGLEDENLDQREDLAVTTDFRTVLSEIVVRRLANPKLGTVFPGINETIYSKTAALGVVKGADLTIDYSSSFGGGILLPLVRG